MLVMERVSWQALADVASVRAHRASANPMFPFCYRCPMVCACPGCKRSFSPDQAAGSQPSPGTAAGLGLQCSVSSERIAEAKEDLSSGSEREQERVWQTENPLIHLLCRRGEGPLPSIGCPLQAHQQPRCLLSS
jgi:hypothetical protein